MRIVIIDDIELCRKSLEKLLDTYCEDVEVVGRSESVESGVSLIQQCQPDLVFLDIEMKDGNSFDLLEKFPNPTFKIIFVTAYEQYAIKAIKSRPIDYLLKPIDIDCLKESVDKAREELNLLPPPKLKSRLAINTGSTIEFIDPNELIRCKASGKYTDCILTDRSILSSKNLKEFELLLSDNNFIRVHDSHLVNLNHVIKFSKQDGGFVLMSNGDEVQVSQRKKKVLLSCLDLL